MSKDNGGAAFPVMHSIDGNWVREPKPEFIGMTLRDYFAGQALQGALSKYGFGNMEKYGEDVCVNALAKNAYTIADAMIEARKS